MTKLAETVERDAHGNVQLSGSGALADLLTDSVKKNLGISRVRGDTLGYLQRSYYGCVSDVDQREAREVAEKAVHYAHWEGRDGSVTIKRSGYYSVEYKLEPLEAIAAKTKTMADEFLNAEGNNITDAFRLYLRPLLGTGALDIARLKNYPVDKVLNK